jgi:hypothetical protein
MRNKERLVEQSGQDVIPNSSLLIPNFLLLFRPHCIPSRIRRFIRSCSSFRIFGVQKPFLTFKFHEIRRNMKVFQQIPE